jgi:RNA ligase (TIGR02306 family)
MNNLATIEKIDKVLPHENADLLEILEVRNCQVIVTKDKFTIGEKVVFIWPDSILPDKEWTAFYRAKSSRVRAIKLRGIFSFGIVEKIETVDSSLSDAEIGTEISEMIGVFKYEPPLPQDLQAKGFLPLGIPKTDEDNYYKFNNLPYGSLVTITRKRDGSSFSCYYDLEEDKFGCMSRSLELKPEFSNQFTEHIARYDIENKLREYCKKHNVSLCIRGESFGNGRNGHKANVDARGPSTWEMFSVWDIKERRYINIKEEHNFEKVANECGFKHVPILERDVPLTQELIKKYTDEKIGFEGVVVHHDAYTYFKSYAIELPDGTTKEINDEKFVEAGTFKIIDKDYDSKK